MERSVSKTSLRSCNTGNKNATRDCFVTVPFYKMTERLREQVGRSLDPAGTEMSLNFRFLIYKMEVMVIVLISEIGHEHQTS